MPVAQYDVNGWLWVNSSGETGTARSKYARSVPAGIGNCGRLSIKSRLAIMNSFNWVDFYEATFHPTEIGCSPRDGGNGADHARPAPFRQRHTILYGHTSGSSNSEFTLSDRDGMNDGNHHDIFLVQHQANGDCFGQCPVAVTEMSVQPDCVEHFWFPLVSLQPINRGPTAQIHATKRRHWYLVVRDGR